MKINTVLVIHSFIHSRAHYSIYSTNIYLASTTTNPWLIPRQLTFLSLWNLDSGVRQLNNSLLMFDQ